MNRSRPVSRETPFPCHFGRQCATGRSEQRFSTAHTDSDSSAAVAGDLRLAAGNAPGHPILLSGLPERAPNDLLCALQLSTAAGRMAAHSGGSGAEQTGTWVAERGGIVLAATRPARQPPDGNPVGPTASVYSRRVPRTSLWSAYGPANRRMIASRVRSGSQRTSRACTRASVPTR